mmetsp:Transcript_9488/g.12478  ORF Transcript_9488/g.12478 Transcript_9488/m.12478 type:complete len:202 (-) Transcript_9488:1948-2553(-)
MEVKIHGCSLGYFSFSALALFFSCCHQILNVGGNWIAAELPWGSQQSLQHFGVRKAGFQCSLEMSRIHLAVAEVCPYCCTGCLIGRMTKENCRNAGLEMCRRHCSHPAAVESKTLIFAGAVECSCAVGVDCRHCCRSAFAGQKKVLGEFHAAREGSWDSGRGAVDLGCAFDNGKMGRWCFAGSLGKASYAEVAGSGGTHAL